MSHTSSTNRTQVYNFLLLGALWTILFTQLWFEWNHNEQYGYGVFMPILGLYLVYSRWIDRPTPHPIFKQSTLFVGILVIVTLILYPTKVIFEANADWRLIAWTQTIITLGATYLILIYWGGWSWAKHFSFPFLFFLFGVPWPTKFEVFTIDTLLGFVTLLTVEILNFSGIFAVQTGNLIRLQTGIISMEEACSGVRSFQSSIMLGFYLGELFRLNIFKRVSLLILGAFFAVFFNIARTTTLSVIGAKEGIQASQHWHNFAGNAVFIACLTSLIIVAFILKKKKHNAKETEAATIAPQWIASRPSLFLCIALLLTEPFVYSWFNIRPPLPYEDYSWKIDWSQIKGVEEKEMAYYIQDVLLYDVGQHSEWMTGDKYKWIAYYFHWDNAKGAQLAGFHGPDLCLPAAGWNMLKAGAQTKWTKDNIELIFNTYVFSSVRDLVHIFYCQWDQSNYPYYTKHGTMREDRLMSAWKGHLKEGKIVLEVVVYGMSSLKQAETALLKMLDQTVVIESPTDT